MTPRDDSASTAAAAEPAASAATASASRLRARACGGRRQRRPAAPTPPARQKRLDKPSPSTAHRFPRAHDTTSTVLGRRRAPFRYAAAGPLPCTRPHRERGRADVRRRDARCSRGGSTRLLAAAVADRAVVGAVRRACRPRGVGRQPPPRRRRACSPRGAAAARLVRSRCGRGAAGTSAPRDWVEAAAAEAVELLAGPATSSADSPARLS